HPNRRTPDLVRQRLSAPSTDPSFLQGRDYHVLRRFVNQNTVTAHTVSPHCIRFSSNGTATNVFDKIELRHLDLFPSRKQADRDVVSPSAARGPMQEIFEPVFKGAEPFIANDPHVIAPDLQELMIGFVGLCVTICCREYQC